MSDPGSGAPRLELLRALAVLAEPPSDEHPRLARLVGIEGRLDRAEHDDLFLFQLYPYASVHLGPEGMLGGEARARIAGFWRAVGHTPPAEPDHFAALLGLYATLLEGASRAEGADGVLQARSAQALLQEHLAPWVFPFLERVEELGGEGRGAWAALVARALYEELDRSGSSATGSLPAHLREAPGLPDPRVEGADPFLRAVLAPARSGMILTRADLARIAGALALGLRAGERRYALEHLLAQAPREVLRALAGEARRAADGHAARRARLPVVSAFLDARARASGELLDALATGTEANGYGAPAGHGAGVREAAPPARSGVGAPVADVTAPAG